ncbi:MAG TPA: site-specific tyrosine recombinase XerC [Solirubrobacterales bacterium]|nr:site-specific tyrosine recombinase XerC [Solirubrobacterales bacterium]
MRKRVPEPIAGDPSDPHGFPALIAEFCEHLSVHGYSSHTVKAKRTLLAMLARWLDERGVSRPAEVTKPMLEGYQRALFHARKEDGSPLSFATQTQRLVAVRTFFEWLARNNRILHDPAAGLELPRSGQRLPRAVLSVAEVERIVALPDLSTPLGLRDRAMLELLYATGVRRAELASLAVFDLDVERRALMVREGKGRKDRMIPTGERAVRWCERYLAEARPELAPEPDNGALFLTVTGRKLYTENLSRLITSYVRRSGVGKPGSCHLFRHTMATLMLEGGADIRYVQQMLGHTDITSTQIYTRVSLRKLEAVHAATHPGAANEPRGVHGGAELSSDDQAD